MGFFEGGGGGEGGRGIEFRNPYFLVTGHSCCIILGY